MPPAEGRAPLLRILERLNSLEPSGHSAIDEALEHYASAATGPGIALVLSDFFEPGAGLQGLQYLLYRGLSPVVVQVVAREEIQPELPPDIELLDVERPHGARLAVDEGIISAYRERLAQHESSLRTFCATHACPWARLVSDMTLEQIIEALQRSGIVRTGDA